MANGSAPAAPCLPEAQRGHWPLLQLAGVEDHQSALASACAPVERMHHFGWFENAFMQPDTQRRCTGSARQRRASLRQRSGQPCCAAASRFAVAHLSGSPR